MKTTRRKYTKEFTQQAVARMQSDECSVEQLARELELEPSLLYTWRRSQTDHDDHAFPGKGHVHEDDELTRLRKEVASLKKERDFLKKAAAYFARE